jgi:RHS repeat-associated protein
LRSSQACRGDTVSTRYTHDLLGHLTGIQDAAGNLWAYSYDSSGRTIAATDPDLGSWTYQYDDADRLTQVTDALGQVTRYTYDAAGRTLTKTTRYGTAQAATTTYTYDQTFASAPYAVGHVTTITDGSNTCLYAYNQRGQVIWQLWSADGANYTVIDSYDLAGRLRWKTYYQGMTLLFSLGTSSSQWAYDGAGRLLSIPGVQTSATYDAAGHATQIVRANGVTTSYTYQATRQWLMGVQTVKGSTQLQNLTFTRDARGRILTSTSDIAAESWTYGYDAIGNITSNSAVGTYTYPLPGQARPHAVIHAGSTSYGYDADGNMIAAGGASLVYDGENRLVQDGATSFVYGPDGSRLKKMSGGVTTLYLGDDWEVTGGISTFYLPGDAVMTNGVVSWLHRDQLDSVRLSTNSAGAVVQRAHYKPYGERLETIASLMTSKGFIGERNDIETGLNYFHARYYDPHLARFITADPSAPMAPGVGLNRYAYAGNGPIRNFDPSGLDLHDAPNGIFMMLLTASIAAARE